MFHFTLDSDDIQEIKKRGGEVSMELSGRPTIDGLMDEINNERYNHGAKTQLFIKANDDNSIGFIELPFGNERLKVIQNLCEPDPYLEAFCILSDPNNFDPPV